MTDIRIKNKYSPMFIRRFKQVIYFTIFMLSLAILSTLSFSESMTTIGLLILDILILCALLPLVKANRVDLAKQMFLWSNLLVISVIFWGTGGLLSSAVILVYPIFLMVSALLVGPRSFFLSFLFVVSFVAIISVHAINNSNSSNVISDFGYWELSIVMILLSANGFTAWRFNEDMRYALRKLKDQVATVKKSQTEIEYLIQFDPLTGLSSRRDSVEKYGLLNSDLDDQEGQVLFLFLDLDNFKSINDYYNHSTGDEILKQVATRLLEFTEDSDVACRLSGDEFLLIITRPRDCDIERLSKLILQKVSRPIEIYDNTIEITASLGIAIRDNEQDESYESLLKRSDLAMYRAKQLGKNKFSFYDEELFLASLRKEEIIKGLKDALKNDDLELYLQPKVDITSGKITGSEALIRWVRNNPKNFSPAEFIPAIESTELICKVGDWVISRACILCKELHDNGYEEVPVAVNISSAQFQRGGLEQTIIEKLQEARLHPRYLELELTEHILFQDDNDVFDELTRIKDLGVKLSIDDFGTGYSNLGYLTKFKVDILKIDQSFVRNINQSSENLAIVDAIIKMAKALGLSVVAEGVENQQEWNVLKQLGCDQGQGFLWSKPLTSDDFLKHISEAA